MGMNGLLRAGISVIVATVAMKILEYCFPMDEIYLAFQDLLTKLVMSAGWKTTAIGVLNMWEWFDRAPVIILIALIVWMCLNAFTTVDYTQQKKGMW